MAHASTCLGTDSDTDAVGAWYHAHIGRAIKTADHPLGRGVYHQRPNQAMDTLLFLHKLRHTGPVLVEKLRTVRDQNPQRNDASDAVGVLTDCLCPAHKSIARVCLSLVCPSQAENLYTKQLLEGVCPGISAVVNFSYPFQTLATTTAEGTTTATSGGSGPDGAAGALRVPVAFPIVAVAVGLFLPLL
ncbi:hypothetical protein CTAM01_07165 [Colletotrichum tamarilloi]|uniref:Uncharacterized protein n=1 Tax=Colletotrichum tamarilloi TaxID=1209934 RepID=A0ABQ9RAU5_9PEZI|nr:uncharacterized protein CTAM01_07165 [Colletotrichum tamarilloi]KAK1499244.1 hypothetical protein CTAM01_07165 [Colletotrichum tamarilloi]